MLCLENENRGEKGFEVIMEEPVVILGFRIGPIPQGKVGAGGGETYSHNCPRTARSTSLLQDVAYI